MNGPRTAAAVVAGTLVAAEVETVFALPGEENLAMVEALVDQGIELVVCRHEQHAAFMAVGHARVTGRLGVCLATLGPGALNLFTGLAQAQLLGVPVLAITGQKPAVDNDEGPFQIVDVVGAAQPLVEHAGTLIDADTAGPVLAAAIDLAMWRRAAVLVEIPDDIAERPGGRSPERIVRPRDPVASEESLSELTELIRGSDRPLLLAGSATNVPQVAEALVALADRSGLGVVTTQMGKGAMAPDHGSNVGSLGMHRPDYVNAAIDDADLIVAVGYQPVEHPPRAWHRATDQPIAHVGVDPPAVAAGYVPDVTVVGDIAATLSALHDVRSSAWFAPYREAIADCLEAEAEDFAPTSAARVPELVRGAVADDTVVALDNGLYKLWFARRYAVMRPGGLLMDNALATMGAGLATGMAAAHAGRRVVTVTGDGGFLMNVAELETASRLGLDLTVIVLRDGGYGFIAWHQDEQGRQNDGVRLGNPDFAALARAFGASGTTIDGPDGLAEALEAARGLTVIDCPIDYSCNSLLERADLPDLVRRRL